MTHLGHIICSKDFGIFGRRVFAADRVVRRRAATLPPMNTARSFPASLVRKFRSSVLATVAAILTAGAVFSRAHAQTITSSVPGVISYQGRVVAASGSPVGTGTPVNRTVIFRIWDHPTNALQANLVYSEQQTAIISDGEFSLLIGQGIAVVGTPLGFSEASKGTPSVKVSDAAVFAAAAGAGRYLGVTIDDGTGAVDPEISPRQQMVTTAYAFRAKYAEALGSNGASAITAVDGGNVGIGNANPPALLTVTGANTSTTTSTPQLVVTADDVTERLRIGVDSTGTGTGFLQAFKEGTGAQNLLLNPSGGNVGLGSATPGFPLTFANALGDKISLSGQSGAHYGFGIASGLLQIHTDVAATDVAFGYGTSAAMTETMRIKGNGNVGIGTSTPGFPLNFSNTFGGKISLWGQSGNTFGLGVQNSLLQIHTDASGADVAFGYGSSASLTETMRIKGTGNVGIGTAAPATKLHVAGGSMWVGEGSSAALATTAGKGLRLFYDSTADLAGVFAYNYASGGGAKNLVLQGPGGRVGIGTSTPAGVLEVNGGDRGSNLYLRASQPGILLHNTTMNRQWNIFSHVGTGELCFYDETAGQYRMFLNATGHMAIGGQITAARLSIDGTGFGYAMPATNRYFNNNGGIASGATGSGPTAIYAVGWIVNTEGYLVGSDARIKAIDGVSDGAQDLELLRRLEVTDYHFKDRVTRGSEQNKKLVAQQVERVFPQAVKRSTDVVPDIYRRATVKAGWVNLDTDLKTGDRVRLADQKTEKVYEVLETKPGAFRTALQTEDAEIFVYGREVNDFRTVDYDAVAMLNVSATQELNRRVIALQAESAQKDAAINALAQRVAELEANDRARDTRLVDIEKLLRASSTVMARPAAAATKTVGTEE